MGALECGVFFRGNPHQVQYFGPLCEVMVVNRDIPASCTSMIPFINGLGLQFSKDIPFGAKTLSVEVLRMSISLKFCMVLETYIEVQGCLLFSRGNECLRKREHAILLKHTPNRR